jgi:Phage derived protein Gp49-like (DUF891)
MLPWKFKTYISPSGRADVQKTIDRYDDYAREAISRQIAHLACSSIDKWDEPHAKKLKAHADLYEIRYKADRKATRALGGFCPGDSDFTITLICTHKQNVYTPPEALATASDRIKQVNTGQAAVAPLQIDGEIFPPDAI